MCAPMSQQHAKQAGARLVHAEMRQRQVGTGQRRRGRDPKRGRGKIARHMKSWACSFEPPRTRTGAALAAGKSVDDGRRVKMGQQPLGVIARRGGLRHAGGALRKEAGQEQARLQLRAGHRQRVLDSGQRTALDLQRGGVLARRGPGSSRPSAGADRRCVSSAGWKARRRRSAGS